MRSAAILALLACFCLSGCTQWRYDLGQPLDESRTPDPAQGVDLTQALATFGPPLRLSSTDTGYVLAWEHWEVDENSLGFSLGAAGAEFLSVDVGNAAMRGEFLLLSFNRQHQLVDASFARWDNSAGSGQAIQPFIGLVSVVEVEDLVRYLPQHRWGGAGLARMPVTLNANSNPDLGDSGLEQRGTPTGAGQRSLEFD